MEESKQQTAVDWLVEQVNSDCLNSTFIEQKIIDIAKQREKQDIKDAYIKGYFNKIFQKKISNYSAEKYYNENYGSNNQI